MAKKIGAEKEPGQINEGYVPSNYKHVEAVLDKKAEEMLERMYCPNWKDVLNKHAEGHRKNENAEK